VLAGADDTPHRVCRSMNVAVLYRSGRAGAVSITDVGLVRAAYVDYSIIASGNHAGDVWDALRRPPIAACDSMHANLFAHRLNCT
jgi:hypothetical protein